MSIFPNREINIPCLQAIFFLSSFDELFVVMSLQLIEYYYYG